MENQGQIQRIFSKLTPEYFADKVVPGVVNVVVILLLMLVSLRAAHLVSSRLMGVFQKRKGDTEFLKRAATLSAVVRYILNFTIITVALVMILGELRIDISPVLATAGIVGLAVGFGAQTLVQDVFAGFFILLDDQIRVGDVVEIAGKSGVVEKVDLRMTTLRDMSGNVHYVRHGKIDFVTNMTKDYSNYVFDIPISYGEDIARVIDVIRDVDKKLRSEPGFADDITAPIEVFGLDRFTDSAVIIRARTTTRPSKQWAVARAFNSRLKQAFEENNIEMPFRQVTIHIGRDSNGLAAPLLSEPRS